MYYCCYYSCCYCFIPGILRILKTSTLLEYTSISVRAAREAAAVADSCFYDFFSNICYLSGYHLDKKKKSTLRNLPADQQTIAVSKIAQPLKPSDWYGALHGSSFAKIKNYMNCLRQTVPVTPNHSLRGSGRTLSILFWDGLCDLGICWY